MTVYRFRATPLTPIHVGNGETLAPEDYWLDGDTLARFNRAAVLRDMAADQRRQLESALDQNNFTAAQSLIRSAIKPAHVLNRISIGAESQEALDTVAKRPDTPVRNREVHPFVFNPLTGLPYLPGSSLKGALRTAVVSTLLGPKEIDRLHKNARPVKAYESHRRRKRLEQRLNRRLNDSEERVLELEARAAAHAQLVERTVLGYGGYDVERRQVTQRLEGDPFRLVKVSDAELKAEATRIDQVWLHKPGSEGETAGIQMHYERLLSRADKPDVSSFNVAIEFDEAAANHSIVRERLGKALDFGQVRDACNAFYWGRMNAELDRFFSKADPHWKSTYNKVKIGLAIRNREGTLVLSPPPWPNRLLLRVGRFSHFESLSVDGLRQGWNIQKKQPITEGSTRTLCRARPDNSGQSVPVPFGWLLLELK